ncbi:MAG: hypothetical protein EBU08_00950 [Micrococcales bacterium]|nr:hypothetical protein [Micrococcales bacterium]
MPIGWAMAGANLLGGYLQGRSAENAARTSADAQLEAARLSAEESRFRPVGVTTRFGSSQFTMDPRTGRLSAAGYTVSPELRAYQDRLMGLSNQALTDAEAARGQYLPLTDAASSLFNLGNQYLAQSPEEVAAKYMQGQQDLLAPSRQRQYAQLQNQLFNTGRGGLAVGATGTRPGGGAGLGASNPETEAYYNAIAQQDAALAANAQAEGQRQLAFGTGLFGQGAGLLGQFQAGQVNALNPFTTYLGGVGTLEELGQQPFNLGVNLGGRNANATGAQALLQGGQNAALTMQQANSYNPWSAALQGAASNPYIQQGVRSLFGGGGSPNAPIEDRNAFSFTGGGAYSSGTGGGGGGGGYGRFY